MNKADYLQLLRVFVRVFLLTVAFYTISDEAGFFDFMGITYGINSKYRIALFTAIIVTFFKLREIQKQSKNSAKPA
jgi:hypothetical protein